MIKALDDELKEERLAEKVIDLCLWYQIEDSHNMIKIFDSEIKILEMQKEMILSNCTFKFQRRKAEKELEGMDKRIYIDYMKMLGKKLFILTIDQRVYHDETKSILVGYENVVNNYKKALIVSQDKTLISKVKNILNKNDVSYSVLYYGLDAVDKIKSHKKYDFILISDEMKEVSGLSTLKEMQKIKEFSSPCIVMLNESKKGLAKHYIEDGFSDYIIIEDIDSLNKKLEKY